MMQESSLKTLIAIASRDEFFSDFRKQALEARDGAPLKNARVAYSRGSVAVIPVTGPLIRHADMFSEISGATSYAALRKDLQAALDNQAVKAILFNIDSPGGEANGCFELADAIYDARSVKSVRAYVGGMGASAAYAIACACETITCAQGAELGSIGVRAGYLDHRRALESAGLKEWVFVSSQSPDKSFDVEVEEDRARLQTVLDDLADVFVGQVARGRDVSIDTVLESFGKGDVMVGERAVAAGLADAIGNFEAVLAELDSGTKQLDLINPMGSSERQKMSVKQRETAVTTAASMATEKCDGCGDDMGMTAKSYCATCMDDDEEECKALGLPEKSVRKDRLARIASLVDFEAHVIEATGTKTAAEARGRIGNAVADRVSLEQLRSELAKATSDGIKRDLRATLETGIEKKKLSLGVIQKSVPIVLRGKTKTAWNESMSKLETVSRETVLDAACSVAIDADDLTAIREFASGASPIAAEPFIEPARDAKGEAAELDETAMKVKEAADKARATFSRGLTAPAK